MRSEFNRRDFHKLATAAVGGILAGSTLGCSSDEPKPERKPAGANTRHGTDQDEEEQEAEKVAAVNDWLGDTHVCRGLNACKNKGASKMNECAGQGTCATKEIHHSCSTLNACKFQGGCGATAGQNDCAKTGGCHVPLMEDAWKGAHAAFEAAMKKAGKPVGTAPDAEKS